MQINKRFIKNTAGPIVGLAALVAVILALPRQQERKVFSQIDARKKEWAKKNLPPKTSRALASEGVECMNERAQFPYLKDDVEALENSMAGVPLSGKWRNLDLSQFSRPAGEFLQNFSEYIYDSPEYDFTGCKTAPCIINKLYEKPDGREGYLAYGFYLRTGYFLAMNDKVPHTLDPPGTYKGVRVPFKNFLFSEQELTMLYRFSFDMPENLKHLPSLKTFHHNPTGMSLSDTSSGGIVVGLASYGWIALKLMDGTLSQSDGGWSGSSLSTILHEVSHTYDYSLGYYSQKQPWLDLSAWYIDEVITEVKNEKGETVLDSQGKPKTEKSRTWRRKSPLPEGAEIPATWYAYTSPTEDFAETNAYFFYQSDTTTRSNLKKSPRKTGFFSDKLWNGNTFWPAEVRKTYIKRAIDSVRDTFYLKSDDCKTTENVESCLCDTIDQLTASAFQAIRSGTTDGCKIFPKSSSFQTTLGDYTWDEKPYLLEDFRADTLATTEEWKQTVLTKDPEIGARMKAMKILSDLLPEKIDVREIFVSCYSESDRESCYNKALAAKLSDLSSNYSSRYPKDTQKVLDTFTAQHPFTLAAAQSAEAVKSLAAPFLSHARDQAQTFYKSCRTQSTIETRTQAPTEEGALLFDPWNGGKEYVAADFIDCINRELISESLSLVEDVKGAIPEKLTENHERLIKAYFTDFLKNAIDMQVNNDRIVEKQAIKTQATRMLDLFKDEVYNHPSWTEGTMTRADVIPKCEKASLGLFIQSLKRSDNPARELFYFNDFKEVYKLRYKSVCDYAAYSGSVSQAVQASYEKENRESLSRFEKLLYQRGLETIESCKAKKEKSLLKKVKFAPVFYMWQLDICLNKNWEQLKANTIEEFVKSDVYPQKAGRDALNFEEFFFTRGDAVKSEIRKSIDKKALLK